MGSPTRLHPGAHPLIIYASSFTFLFFWFLTFFGPSFISFCALSLFCAICLPSASPVMPQMAFVKDGKITEDFYLSDPSVPFIFLSQLDLSHTSASYCCLAAGSRPRARLASLSSCHHYPGPLLGISQQSGFAFLQFHISVKSTPPRSKWFFFSETVDNIDAPGSSTGCL